MTNKLFDWIIGFSIVAGGISFWTGLIALGLTLIKGGNLWESLLFKISGMVLIFVILLLVVVMASIKKDY